MAQIDNLPQRFSDMLQSFKFEERQLFLRDVLGEVTVGDGNKVSVKVSVKGCTPLEREVQNNGLWTSGRDSWNGNKQIEANVIPFELKFRLPPLRKWRIIMERDQFGRIIY